MLANDVLVLRPEVETHHVRRMRLTFAMLTAFGLLCLSAVPMQAKPEFAKKEKKGCTTCHVSAKTKDLNETGKYYKEHKELPKTN